MNDSITDEILEEQQELTAIEKFALRHDMHQIPQGQSVYEELIPKTTPGPGQQYAFAVDLDKCTGCKACITACHNENGLEEDESWRSVGLIQGGTTQEPVLQHITSACHHCLEPACASGCPVNAYEKDPSTGVVKHLEDQCIGCQYCTFTCPYDVPKYNKKKGIVHKCDMCISRLNVGEAPACVRACPSGAIRISLVEVDAVKENPTEYVKIPDAPNSYYTFPTTRYITKRDFPENMESVDFYSIKPEHSHMPLIAMLVLTQLSVGAFFAILFLKNDLPSQFRDALTPYHVLMALGVGLLALVVSIFHLGRPLYAFRVVIGLKKSWLSREIIAFGIFAFLATIYAMSYWFNSPQGLMGIKLFSYPVMDALAVSTAAVGALGVFCSVMVYKVTHRPFWDNPMTTMKFFLTTGILGISSILLTTMIFSKTYTPMTMSFIMQSLGSTYYAVLASLTIIKLFVEASIFLHLGDRKLTSLKKTVLLMRGPFGWITFWRFVCGVIGGILLPLLFSDGYKSMGSVGILGMSFTIFFLSLSGEFLERYLFFRTVVSLKMPGAKIS